MITPKPQRLPSERSFGIIFAVVFLLAAGYFYHKAAGLYYVVCPAALGCLFLIAALAKPAVLRPLNHAWMQLGLLLHRIVNPIVMGVIFFLLFTPIAVVMRVFKRDALGLRKLPGRDSCWIARESVEPDPSSFRNQF